MSPWSRTERAHGRPRGFLSPALTLCILAPAAAAQEKDVPSVSGLLLTRYRCRATGGESDHDLYQTVDLNLSDPARRWSGALLARASLDLDGRDDPDSDFFGLRDTYEHRLEAQLFHAYLDVPRRPLALLRLGRQPLYETPVTVVIDGLRAELAPWGELRGALGLYAGIGEHVHESSSDDDLVLGSFGAARPWPGAELRVDWMRLEDARLGTEHEDDLLGLALSQDFHGETRATGLEGRFTSLEGDGRDLRLVASHAESDARFTLQGSLYRLLRTQKQLAAPLDPFSEALFELAPYTQVGLSAAKDWEHVGLLSGADVRRVEESSDEGAFNREFERYYLTATLSEVLAVTVSLTGELWRASETDLETWGATLARELGESWEVSLGSHYALYEYDLFSAQERDHVRNYTLDVRWKRQSGRRWTLRYELERNDFDDYHELRLDCAWSF